MTDAVRDQNARSARRRRRQRLSRSRVLDAGLEFIDAHGVEELSMRRLAATLDVEAMALYRHVNDKEDLLIGVIDKVIDAFDPPDESMDWRNWVREIALGRYRMYADHPRLIPVLLRYWMRSEPALRITERSLERLEREGFDSRSAHQLWHLLASHVLGNALVGRHRTDYVTAYGRDDRFPTLRRYVDEFQSCDRQWEFDVGLDLILDTFEAKLPARRVTSS